MKEALLKILSDLLEGQYLEIEQKEGGWAIWTAAKSQGMWLSNRDAIELRFRGAERFGGIFWGRLRRLKHNSQRSLNG